MGVSRESELLDQIENLEDGREALKDIYEEKLRKQRAEIIKDLKGCHYHWTLNIKDLIKKWKGKQK